MEISELLEKELIMWTQKAHQTGVRREKEIPKYFLLEWVVFQTLSIWLCVPHKLEMDQVICLMSSSPNLMPSLWAFIVVCER